MMNYFVYILHCADTTLYTGITTDLTRRLREHNSSSGKGAKYTQLRRPVRLAYSQPQPDRSAALQAEAALKKLTRAQKLELIRSALPDNDMINHTLLL